MAATTIAHPYNTPTFAPSDHHKPRSASASTRRPANAAHIGKRWPELQGSRDWAGLLDPVDDTLRGEIARYGQFVRAAYASFDFAGASSYGSCRFPRRSLLCRSGLPASGYEVTRVLHAAASGNALSPECPGGSSSYIGYVAVCEDEDEIRRLGRRDVVVAFRGTVTRDEWRDNFRSTLTRVPAAGPSPDAEGEPAAVQSGFWRLFTSPSASHASLRSQVRGEVERIVRAYRRKGEPPLSVTVTGHSLGAALAVLTGYDIATSLRDAPRTTVMSFAGPRIANAAFRRRLEGSGCKVLRIVNPNDVVTKLPGLAVDDSSRAEEPAKRRAAAAAAISRWVQSRMGWGYADIGQELRLCGRQMANVAASHDLDLYLALVAATAEQ